MRFNSASPYNHLMDYYRIVMDEDVVQEKLEKQRKIAEVHRDDRPVLQFTGLESRYTYLVPDMPPNNSEAYTVQDLPLYDTLTCRPAIAQLLGGRKIQEDRVLASSFDISIPKSEAHPQKTHTILLTGVFDGHSGPEAALFMKNNLENKLKNTFTGLFYKCLSEDHPLKVLEKEQSLSDRVIWNVLKVISVELHNECTEYRAGTTASFSLVIDGSDVWTSNLGDSRTFVTSREKTIPLSEDMKIRFGVPPHLTQEKFAEIEAQFNAQKTIKIKWSNSYERGVWKRGGHIDDFSKRLNGGLAIPRAIGDKSLKEGICRRPKITKISLFKEFPSSDFCILVHGSDGLFDTATTDQIADIINEETRPLSKVAVNLAHSSVQFFPERPLDNVSIVMTRIDLRALRTARETK